jgi:hypothetical protein
MIRAEGTMDKARICYLGRAPSNPSAGRYYDIIFFLFIYMLSDMEGKNSSYGPPERVDANVWEGLFAFFCKFGSFLMQVCCE